MIRARHKSSPGLNVPNNSTICSASRWTRGIRYSSWQSWIWPHDTIADVLPHGLQLYACSYTSGSRARALQSAMNASLDAWTASCPNSQRAACNDGLESSHDLGCALG